MMPVRAGGPRYLPFPQQSFYDYRKRFAYRPLDIELLLEKANWLSLPFSNSHKSSASDLQRVCQVSHEALGLECELGMCAGYGG